MRLIQKGDSNSKHFSFFAFYLNVSNKISSTPPRLLNFQEFSNPPFIPTPAPRLLSFEEFSNPPFIPTLPPPPLPSIRHSRVLFLNKKFDSRVIFL